MMLAASRIVLMSAMLGVAVSAIPAASQSTGNWWAVAEDTVHNRTTGASLLLFTISGPVPRDVCEAIVEGVYRRRGLKSGCVQGIRIEWTAGDQGKWWAHRVRNIQSVRFQTVSGPYPIKQLCIADVKVLWPDEPMGAACTRRLRVAVVRP